MIIQSSNLVLMSSRSYQEERVEEERCRYWVDKGLTSSNQANPTSAPIEAPSVPQDTVAISPEATQASQAAASCEDEDNLLELSPEDKLKISLIQTLIEKLTGKKFRFVIPASIESGHGKSAYAPGQLMQMQSTQPQSKAGWGFQYDYRSFYHESEQTSFEASGVVKTADGQQINISLNVNMSREFMVQNEIHIRAGDARAVDPLVINYQGNAAALTQKAYAFDLNSDGNPEDISFLKPGSGFLALDENGDGIINNGNELFGAETGDGFAELSAYDEDGNGWIDEGDAVYNRLQIWCKDEQGADTLLALGQAGVGAIYLGNIGTQFSITDNSNNDLGYVRSSGLFLRENGSVGSVQQVDLVV